MRQYTTILKSLAFCLALLVPSLAIKAKTWTLEECISYAMENNVSLQKAGLARQSSAEDWKSSRAALLPSMNFSTSHNVTYKPWQYAGTAMVTDGQVQSSIDKTYYNGSYTVNANWTVWNAGRNTNQVKASRLQEQQAELDSITSALNLQEQIAQLYIQILYTKEAVNVNIATLEVAKVNEERGKAMMEVGALSRADLSQLTATRAQDEYNVVQSQNQVRTYTRQLKELLQITECEDFDVALPEELTTAMALQQIPAMASVYEVAVERRPEMQRAKLSAQSAGIQARIASAMRMPTVSMNAALGSNTNTMSKTQWGEQMKVNLNMGAGVTVSVPILDQRQSRTAVNKARIQQQQAMLDIKDRQTALYSTIENYWIQAGNYQGQFRAAQASVQSAQDSYSLLSEQFALGLKNIVELQEGKVRLLSAQHSELQSKYMAILNIKMLEFYSK